MIKNLFAIFCAFCLLPLVSAQAWIGGPFSNNTYFGNQGDDGVYEATATAVNGLGLYRIVVGNNFQGVNSAGVNSSVPSQIANPGNNNPLVVPGINSGNLFFGALGSNFSNIWYYQGVAYFGTALGTVNSVQGIVAGVGRAFTGAGGTGNSVGSFFSGVVSSSGRFLPSKSFTAVGELRVSTAAGVAVPITVFGNKVSDAILFGL